MSIQGRDSSEISTGTFHWQHVSAVVLFLAAAIPLIGFIQLVRSAPVLPSLCLMALASAAILAFAAWTMLSNRNSVGISFWHAAGAYAFIGFAAGMVSDPEQIMEFWSDPTNSSEGSR
jgi:hypothetical protein